MVALKTKPKLKQKSLSQLKKQAWDLLSQCIRREAADSSGNVICYTCGATHHWKEIQAGHAIGGRHNAVLLNESVIRPQCMICNIFKRGNYQTFITKLIVENGFEWWTAQLADSRSTLKYDRIALESLKAGYKARLQALEAIT